MRGIAMPWFPDFFTAAELARRQTRDPGQAVPAGRYLTSLGEGDTRSLEGARALARKAGPDAIRPRPAQRRRIAMEYLVTMTTHVPDGTPEQAVDHVRAGEAARARELADQGYLERLWALPGQGRALGLYRARDSAEMEAIVKALPLNPWMTTELTPLTPHPSDPATMST